MQAVLLVNLGSPDSFAVPDVRRYLEEFLMDEYVIDVPTPLRSLIVKGAILPFRPRRSAAAYRSVWWEQGSPLVVLSERLTERVSEQLPFPTALAMRYGKPSIQDVLEQLCRDHPDVNEILLVPMYPQYAMATTKTVVERTRAVLPQVEQSCGRRLALRVVKPFYQHPLYINALAATVKDALPHNVDFLLMSYHGVPERHLHKTDPTNPNARKGQGHCLNHSAASDCCENVCMPNAVQEVCYRHHAFETSRLLASALQLEAEQWGIAFQSRLGSDAWLKPYTADELKRLAQSGVQRLAVACPAFVADCLETLEEIGEEGREIFLHNGGKEFTLIPCMNDHPAWVDALGQIIMLESASHTQHTNEQQSQKRALSNHAHTMHGAGAVQMVNTSRTSASAVQH
jgi:ferrochelatase